MAKKERNSILTEKQEKELQNIASEMVSLADRLVQEFQEDIDLDKFKDLSELSSSLAQQVTQIHEDSPFLDELFEGDTWKRVIKNIPPIPTTPKKNKNDDTE
tara:strand:+ start:232 stop:537 length:306 start_codon:yes stop_codon:yes gene_type:complete